MTSFYIILAFIVAITQRSHASFPTIGDVYSNAPSDNGLTGTYMGGVAAPVIHAAPMLTGPVLSSPIYQPSLPYTMNLLRPRAELRNYVSAYSRENRRLSDTSMMIPLRKRKMAAARVARMRKNLRKKNRN